MRRPMVLMLAAAVAACTRPPVPPTARDLYELGPMRPFAWLLGDWRSDAGSSHWVAAGDKVYGVAFDRGAFRQGFQVTVIEDERDPGHTQGIPTLQSYDGPETFNGVQAATAASRVRFRQAMAEGPPFEVALSRLADELQVSTRRSTAQRTLGPPESAAYEAYGGDRSPALEAADRALVAAVNDRSRGALSTSGEVWATAFAPDGAYWCERCVVGAMGRASAGELSPRNNPGTFDWVPVTSRRSGDLGFTAGHLSYRPRLRPEVWRGTYLTVWRRGADGRWSILFYTRRSAPAVLPEPQS